MSHPYKILIPKAKLSMEQNTSLVMYLLTSFPKVHSDDANLIIETSHPVEVGWALGKLDITGFSVVGPQSSIF